MCATILLDKSDCHRIQINSPHREITQHKIDNLYVSIEIIIFLKRKMGTACQLLLLNEHFFMLAPRLLVFSD